MEATFERNNRFISMAITLCFAALLLIVFLFIKFVTPIPAFEESENVGLAVNLGYDIAGMGDNNSPDPVASEQKTKTESNPQPVHNSAEMLSSEEASNVVAPPVKNRQEEIKVEEPKPDQALLNALNKKHTAASSNSGDGNTNTPGNQGDENGTLASPSYSKGKDDGIEWQLRGSGRKMIGKIQVYDDSQETGIVAVEYIVDRYGKVIKAEPVLIGSTTTSAVLWRKAKQGMLNSGSLFNQSATGEEARGTIYFNFTVR